MLSRVVPTIFLLAGAGAAFAQSGIVKSQGIPIPGATVTATQGGRTIVTTTDENGRYNFQGLTPGACKYEVRMFGFRAEQREAQIPSQLEWNLQIPQRPDPSAFRARAAQANQAQTELNQEIAAADTPASASTAEAADQSANDAFLVNGSLSQGLQNGQEDAVLPRRLMAQALDGGGPGMNGMQPPGVPGGEGPGGGGFAGGRGGGFGGGRGGFGGGGGFRGGPGGFRGRGSRGRNGGFIGNRAGRGRDTSLHGALFYQFGNSAFDAAPFSFSQGPVAKPQYSSSRFGGTIGGPFQIPKLFKSESTYFFLNYFGTRSSTSSYNVGTVPTAVERSGDFSQSVVNGVPVSLFDPITHQPLSGNVIPASRIDPAAAGLLSFIPLPNQPGTINNYVFTTSVPQNSDNLNVRFNQNITKKDRLGENFNLQDRSGSNPYLFGFLDETSGRGLSTRLNWTHNISAESLNIVTFAFNRNRSTLVPYFAGKTDVASALGINGVSSNPSNYGPPNLTFTNYASLADGSPSQNAAQYASVQDAYTIVKGSHTLSAGMSYRRTDLNTITDSNGRGTFSFSGIDTSAFGPNGQPVPNTGYDFADFLLGLPQSSSIRYGDSATYFRGNQWGAFGQDDWRIRSNLTLLIGLRWEYYSPLSEKYGHFANLAVGPDFASVSCVAPIDTGGVCAVSPVASLVNPDKHDFAPRTGLSWKPFSNHSLQVRAGYGIYYNPTVYNQFASRLAAQPPFANTASLVGGVDSSLSIENGLVIPPGRLLNTWAVDPNYLVGSAQSWTFSLQQELPKSIIVDLGYLGTKGTHLDIETVPNLASGSSQRVIRDATGFTYQSSNANSTYNGLQARVFRRFRRGISFNATYTFSKSIDNSSTFGGVGNTVAQNAYDISAERGLSSFDQRHVLRFNYVLTAPKLSHAILADWTLSGGITATSGTPFTARVLGNQSNIGGTGSVGAGRAEATGLPVLTDAGFFNVLAFTVPQSGELGDAGRNTIPGLAQWSWNTAFGRSFRFGETRRSLEFRIQTTNLLNHVNFTSIGTVVNASNYGIPLAASAMRQVNAVIRFRF